MNSSKPSLRSNIQSTDNVTCISIPSRIPIWKRSTCRLGYLLRSNAFSISSLPALALILCHQALAQPFSPIQDDFTNTPEEWKAWSPREAIAPESWHDQSVGFNDPGALVQEGAGNAAAFGAWKRTVAGIQAGTSYRFEVYFKSEGVENEQRSIIPRLLWKNSKGRQARPPDFITGDTIEQGWTKVDFTTRCPEGATEVEIQLGFGFAPHGRVWWDAFSFSKTNPAPARKIRAATIHHRPQRTQSSQENLKEFSKLITQAADHSPDIICLPEGITVVGTGQSYADASELVPGPTTELLGQLAKTHQCYIVAGIYERVGLIVYNTAVLIDRRGILAGRYRKTHLPREEWEAGITPGDQYPIFETDFGKIGMMICWDVQFPEPARAMARKGAEILLLPIWGGNETLTRARAIENHVYLVSSSYDMRSFAIDPLGKVLAEATIENPIAIADISLDDQLIQPWTGNMKHRTWKERRPDIAVD